MSLSPERSGAKKRKVASRSETRDDIPDLSLARDDHAETLSYGTYEGQHAMARHYKRIGYRADQYDSDVSSDDEPSEEAMQLLSPCTASTQTSTREISIEEGHKASIQAHRALCGSSWIYINNRLMYVGDAWDDR